MLWIVLFPFMIQGAAMFLDEFVYHHKRRLPLWERIGHPLDTLTVLGVYLLPFFTKFSDTNVRFFVFAALFSSLFVTKDEFVHSKVCDANEQWLHSVLFVLHPVQFLSAALLWAQRDNVVTFLGIESGLADTILRVQTVTLIVFLFYQILYWNIKWPKKSRSTTTSMND